jgi:hypothetical protein
MAERPDMVTSNRRQMSISFPVLSQRRRLRQIAKGDYQLHRVCMYVALLPKLIPLPYVRKVERDSSVGIATRYGLDGPGIVSRWG